MSEPQIGIALSGGGSRAIAFHLGCLRTLNQLGLLQRCRVLSTVSGGSMIGAMYVTHSGSFEEFEADVQVLLRRGLAAPSLVTALITTEGLRAILCMLLLVAAQCIILPLRWVTVLLSVAMRREVGQLFVGWSPIRRFASRTTILRRTLDRLVFKRQCLGDLGSSQPRLIAIAAELRTGAAFYFSPGGSGCWRFGRVNPARIPVAHAVAASAAYPLLLPAIDEVMTFDKRDGSRAPERVTLTDGGIYDNLGLAPLWPDRDPSVSIGVEALDTIIACRAGYGLRFIPPSTFFVSRLKASFATVHERAQNATMKRLFDLKDAGRLRCFVLPYLGQADDRLKFPPPDLIPRDEVSNYPTDFFAMPAEWIDRLSKRGEQLTLAVIRENAPELLEF